MLRAVRLSLLVTVSLIGYAGAQQTKLVKISDSIYMAQTASNV